MTTIYHNPRCSKSRQTLALLGERGIEPDIIEYLETPPSVEELTDILAMLGLGPRDIMRKKEAREAGLDDPGLDDAALIKAMVANPIVIERPIVVNNGKAALGRPPESVADIL
ncbi:MAG TPA: arsenate reductase (glutaredoxin) [Rhodospirillales bacterium]|jgi:arsenate reductase|nr:arsenate reductase (glutaredoxin) [Rhodospirillales bacterium]